MHARSGVYYKVDRTYITDADGRTSRQYDLLPLLVAAESAPEAVAVFAADDGAVRVVGEVTAPAGDKAVATLSSGRRLLVIFVQRAAESIEHAPEARAPRE